MKSPFVFILFSLILHGLLLFPWIKAVDQPTTFYQSTVTRYRVDIRQPEIISSKANEFQPKPPAKRAETKAQKKNKQLKNNDLNQIARKGSEGETHKYISAIYTIIEKNKFYPRIAERLRHQGVVTVRFRLLSNGKVDRILSITSPFSTLKNAVEEIITQRAEFPSFPPELSEQYLDIQVPVSFSLI